MANFVFTLSKNDVTAATRCFQFAKVAHQKGHDVFVYFFDDGVLWADKSRNWAEKTASGDCPDDHFPYLLEKEVAVGVWPPCAHARQVDEAKFFPNMAMDGAGHMIDLVAEGRVFNF